jgi:hypothetical protein
MELEVGRSLAERIPEAPVPQVAPPEVEENKLVRVAIESPEGAIILSFIELEKVLMEIGGKLGRHTNIINYAGVIKDLVDRGALGPEAGDLFASLRRARNSAAHGQGKEELSTKDAVEYMRQVELLVRLLELIKERL